MGCDFRCRESSDESASQRDSFAYFGTDIRTASDGAGGYARRSGAVFSGFSSLGAKGHWGFCACKRSLLFAGQLPAVADLAIAGYFRPDVGKVLTFDGKSSYNLMMAYEILCVYGRMNCYGKGI